LDTLRQFKFIYILFFLADILHSLAMLFKIFQLKFIDATIVGSIVRNEIAQICIMFNVDSYDLNVDVFNESTCYHFLRDYGRHDGYLRRLYSQVKGNMFYIF